MRAVGRIDQLRGDANTAASFTHRAFKDVTYAQVAADLLHIDGLALVGESRIAGNHEEPADLGERGDDLLDHAIREILLIWVAAHVGKGENSDRRLVGEGRTGSHLPGRRAS